MKTLWKSSLILAAMALGLAAASSAALADDHGGHNRKDAHAAPPAAYHQLHGNNKAVPAPVRHAAPPAAYHQLYGNNNHRALPPPAHHDRDADRGHVADRGHDNRVIVRPDRDHDRFRGQDRDRYVRRDWFWARNWDRDWDDRYRVGWMRYDPDIFGIIPVHQHIYTSYGAQWMWWGGLYEPYDPPAAFRNCYPVVRFGTYDGHRARLGGTMCYRAGVPYLLPSSVFVITLF